LRFIHCEQCGETARIAVADDDQIVARFSGQHDSRRLRFYEPTGRAEASGPWHEPMSTRRLEVRGEDGPAMAIGVRRFLDAPLVWRIERQESEERTEVELDRPLFWAAVDRALYPSHLPGRPLDEWAGQIERFARSADPADIVLLDDDPNAGNATFACLTLTARARLEADLGAFGFDAEIQGRLAALFDQEHFPPLRVRRILMPAEQRLDGPATREPALTR